MNQETTLDPHYDHNYHAILEFHLDAELILVPVDQSLDPALAYDLNSHCPGPGFVVLTAFNPRGVEITADENEQRQDQLEVRLMEMRKQFVRCDGYDAGSDHRERGVAVHLERPLAHDIGVEFEQSAMYWFDGTRFWLVPILARDRRSELLPQGDKTHGGTTTMKI
jgi:Protein of unknown function (DUF3293)